MLLLMRIHNNNELGTRAVHAFFCPSPGQKFSGGWFGQIRVPPFWCTRESFPTFFKEGECLLPWPSHGRLVCVFHVTGLLRFVPLHVHLYKIHLYNYVRVLSLVVIRHPTSVRRFCT